MKQKTGLKALIAVMMLTTATSAFLRPALAQSDPPAKGQGPVEIEADQLRVFQAEQKAIFQGNVLAVQGDLKLRSAEMIVFYNLEQEQSTSGQSISRIDVAGDVVITSPAETATGDRGTYDVIKGTLMLEENVILTRENNVITGDKLEIDLNTDTALVTTEKTSEDRVQAIFTPASLQDSGSASESQ